MELRSCYFCGSTGTGLATRELVPDSPAPDADEPITVVLCPSCDAKLDRLLDGLRGGERRESDSGDAPAAGVADERSDAFDFSSEITFADAAPESEGGEEEPEIGDADGDDVAGVDAAPEPDAGGEAAGDADAGGREAAGDTGDDPSGTLRGLGEGSTNAYRQALRLLQNREFPMARSDLVDVMSSAYDLDPRECERLVDLAVDRGWLVEEGGELRRG